MEDPCINLPGGGKVPDKFSVGELDRVVSWRVVSSAAHLQYIFRFPPLVFHILEIWDGANQ